MRNFLIIGSVFCLTLISADLKEVKYPYSWSTTQNPIITHIYTADPSAFVGPDGKLWLYPSHDDDNAEDYNSMDSYHIFSTEDLVNWTDYGVIFGSGNVNPELWGNKANDLGPGHMWAPDCVYKDGVYYLYYPKHDARKIGVATSTSPTGPFVDQGMIEGTSRIDPRCFIDDEGKAYLFWGGGGDFYRAELKANMMEIDGECESISSILTDPKEGPWVWKHNGIYYLMYASNTKNGEKFGPDRLLYGTLDGPMGDFTYKGVLMKNASTHEFLTGTSHGSVLEFKGKSYLFYHSAFLSGGNRFRRSVHVDQITYNPDNTIQEVIPSVNSTWPWYDGKIKKRFEYIQTRN